MIIELSKYKVELKEELSWWDLEEVKSVQMSGVQLDNTGLKGFDASSMLKATLKLIQLSVISVKDGENEIGYSDSWLKNLSVSDGEKLHSAVEVLSTPKVKKN
jgi:hypothetical protein